MAEYTFKSVSKPRANAGAGQSVNPNVRLVKSDDILYFPNRDTIEGIYMEENIILKPGARFFELYLTPSTHKKTLSTEGDDDAEGFPQSYEGWHPGDDPEINAFAQNALNENFVGITINCQGNYRRVYGSPCNPIRCTVSMEGTNEKTGWTFTFAQKIREGLVPAFYSGELPKVDPFQVAGSSVSFTKQNGAVYQLTSIDVTADITMTNVDFEHGQIVSVRGGGGLAPFEIKTADNILLANGTSWVGLNNSVIHFKVFKTATDTIFIETGRN